MNLPTVQEALSMNLFSFRDHCKEELLTPIDQYYKAVAEQLLHIDKIRQDSISRLSASMCSDGIDLCERLLFLSYFHNHAAPIEDYLREFTFIWEFQLMPEEIAAYGELGGTLGMNITHREKLINQLTPIVERSKIVKNILLGIVLLLLAVFVLFNPTIRDFFNSGWLEEGFVLIGALSIIVVFFVGGFLGSVITLIAFALCAAFLDHFIGLGLLVRLLIAVIVGLFGIDMLKTGIGALLSRLRFTKEDRLQRIELQEDLDILLQYAEDCLAQSNRLLLNRTVCEHYEHQIHIIQKLQASLRSKG